MIEKNICLFTGDSITDAGHIFTDDNLGRGYVSMIQNRFPELKIVNRGYDGFTARRLNQDWEKMILQVKPDVLTILIGINDLGVYFRGYEDFDRNLFSPKHFEEDFELLIKKAKDVSFMIGKEMKIISMEPFVFSWPDQYKNWIEPLELYRDVVKRVSEKYHLSFIPLYELIQNALQTNEVRELTVDGIHLTEKGHALLANAWSDVYIKKIS